MTGHGDSDAAGSLAGMPLVWHPDCLLHEPEGEVWLGVWEPGTEVPERAKVLLEALTSAGGVVMPAGAPHRAAAPARPHTPPRPDPPPGWGGRGGARQPPADARSRGGAYR